ncbi:MAG: flagellar motor switch protein FliG [Pirellulaceae bacterium]|nr:MAG: flagellar motor switch protein FliG [Pirellulaceae bacterium]GIW95075.1 MAG: flagellar motor switch protein FliG [Pirellulaceae bacterium]
MTATEVGPKLRKAALLVASLDEASARRLIGQLPPPQAARLRQAIKLLSNVDPDEQAQVIREFLENRANYRTAGPVEIQLSASAPDSPGGDRPATDLAGRPFRFLDEVDPEELAQLLSRQHPQIIAVVLAYVSPEKAAGVLELLPEDQQADILRRIAELDNTEPEVLQELERELSERLRGNVRGPRRAGLSAVRRILEVARDAGQHDLWERLCQWDRTLARRIALPAATASSPQAHPGRQAPPTGVAVPPLLENTQPAEVPPRFSFDDVLLLDDTQLAQLLGRADPQVVLVALAGAEPACIERIRRKLPRREARRLDQQLRRLHPLRLADVEWAQQQLAQLALQILESDEARSAGSQPAAARG